MNDNLLYLKRPHTSCPFEPDPHSLNNVYPGDPESKLPESRDTLFKNFLESVQRYPNREAFGRRVENDGNVSFDYLSYTQALKQVESISGGFASLNVIPGERVAILGPSRVEWMLTDLAIQRSGLITVGIYADIREADQLHILRDSGSSILLFSLCCQSSAEYLLKHASSQLKAVVCMDDCEPLPTQLPFFTFSKFCSLNNSPPAPCNCSSNDVATLVYSSGTSGPSKGAMLTHRNVLSGALSYNEVMPPSPDPNHQEVILSYLPLSHIFERTFSTAALIHACKIGYFSGKTSTLVGDIQAVKPTVFIAVPRVLSKIYNGVITKVNNSFFLKRFLFNKFYECKRTSDLRGRNSRFLTKFFKNSVAQKFGGRLRVIYFGSAKCDPEIVEFLQTVLSIPVNQGWGMSETSAAGTVVDLNDKDYYTAGTIKGRDTQIRLRSIPELGYSVTDDPPRGEIEIRGSVVCKGYWG
ncbi:hypothetical protein P9112_008628 [Eukaryota sp. TZLM1-RC]